MREAEGSIAEGSIAEGSIAEGSIQELYGQAVDSAEDAIDTVRQMPAFLDSKVRRYIESNPYTTAAIALGLGWLIGRSHRPF
jgi:ElaB/YqjD/DUF883 family membrane-anchored ribosome-binding protein